MKKIILPIVLLHLAAMLHAATYYVSSVSGDDSRTATQAQNSSTPWKTLSKLNSVMLTLKAGDQVLFKRGETFDGSLSIGISGTSAAPVLFGAYGSGNKPVINGFSVLWGWKRVSGNIWECPFWQPTGAEKMVVRDGKQLAIGRYPNRDSGNNGYLTVTSHSGATELTSSQLTSAANWTGADIVIRKNRWVLDRSTVTYQYGSTIGFVSASSNSISDKYGFFIENSASTLDQDGEWYYDRSRTKMQMYMTSSNPNSNYSMRASTVETLVNLYFAHYITFDNLVFQGANQYAFNLTNSENITINACDINFTGTDAVKALSSPYFTFTNNTVSNTNNDGLNMYWNCSNATFLNNLIKNTGTIAGMGQSNTNTYDAVYIRGNNNLIQNNEIDSTGFNGIQFEGDYDTVKNNFVNVFNFVVDDGSGIYTGQGLGDNTVYNSKSIIGNIVLNGVGAPAGTDNTSYIATQGIYLDDNTNHVSVLNNTVANCGQTGIFNHNATHTNIANNTLYNNGKEQFLLVRMSNPVSDVTFTGNICFSKTASQFASRIESYYGSNNLPALGTMSNNYYCRPIDNNYIFYSLYQSGSGYIASYDNLSTWQSKFGLDSNSKGAPATFSSFSASNMSGINKYTNGTFGSNVNGVGTFASNGDLAASWLSSKLDAGTFQAASKSYSSTNNYMLTFPLSSAGTVTAGKSYLLSLSLQGAVSNAPMTVYLRQSGSGSSDLSTRTLIPVSAVRNNLQFGITATGSSQAAIELDVASPNGAVWVDNLSLQDATITQTNPDDYIVFQYNPSASSKTFTLNDTYYDAKGAIYSGTVTLQPYTSVVLFKQSESAAAFITSTDALQSLSAKANLVDASAASNTGSSSSSITWSVDNQHATASYYQVERSADNSNYTTLGKTNVKTNNDATVSYRYNDATPLSGKNYYRITQYDEKGVAGISKVVIVNNISLKINPNPVQGTMHLFFNGILKADDHVGRDIVIRNLSGAEVKSLQLPATDNISSANFDVSSLKSGMYTLSITLEGETISKKFIKQ